MEYILQQNHDIGAATILCCECGIAITPNPSNTCVACLRNRIDISENIPKQCTLYFCRNCERYLQPPSSWIHASLESKELLALCLKKIKGIDKEVRLVDAGFLWTEPHSKRIKVKVIVQKEVVAGAVLQQTFSVEYIVNNQMCDECHRVEAKDYWRACVQVRQKAQHKKTLYYMEQIILKHRAHANSSSIKQVHEGLDFFYQQQQDARKLVDFLQSVVPCRTSYAKELISHDIRSNIFNYKHTHLVELVPLCKDDVVCLPLQLARQLGNIGQVCVVTRITQSIYLIDPSTCRSSVLRADVYWRDAFPSMCRPKDFTEFIVMNIEISGQMHNDGRKGQGAESNKHVLAEVWVVKASELGTEDRQYHCRTHLGHLLKHGDSVLGFDLMNANVNNDHLEKMKQHHLPDIILIKKVFGSSSSRARKRKWKLHHLDREDASQTLSTDNDFNDFLEDLEEDQTVRQNINIFKDASKTKVDENDTDGDDEDAPGISLAEMIDELNLNEDATGGEGADMIE